MIADVTHFRGPMAEFTLTAPKPNDEPALKSNSAGGSNLVELGQKFEIDFHADNAALESKTAEERVAWGLEKFGADRIALSSSFGAQSAVSLHMVNVAAPGIPVILVDTGYLFPETYQFIDQLTERLNLNLKIYSNPLSPAWQEARFGKMWGDGLESIEKYNQLNKVEPMDRSLKDLNVDLLLAGIRRQQSGSREKMPALVAQKGRAKLHPIIDWTDLDIFNYLKANDLPYHPLWDEGYVSIGDVHTTRKLTDGMTEEETRFFGLKRECGLHEEIDFSI